MNTLDAKRVVALVRSGVGLRKDTEAWRALGATLGALRGAMDEEDARNLSKDLPDRLARVLRRPTVPAIRSARSLYAEVARRERIELGYAMEQAQVVLRVLASELDGERVALLRRRLPSDIAGLLRRERLPGEPPPYVHAHPARRGAPPQTLSRARPGAAEPIAEVQHDVAHTGSVARTARPHAETMVETARSTRPGREDETLASGRSKRGELP